MCSPSPNSPSSVGNLNIHPFEGPQPMFANIASFETTCKQNMVINNIFLCTYYLYKHIK